MNQNGYVKTALIVLVIVLTGVVGYVMLAEKPEPRTTQSQPSTKQSTPQTASNGSPQNSVNWDKDRTPKFEDFPVSNIYKGVYAQIDFSSHPLAAQYKTLLGNGVQRGATFAGHYAVASFGCGTSCANSLIVDVSTGKVYDGISTAGNDLSYQVSSELIFDPEPHYSYVGVSDENNPKVSKQYFVFRSNQLRLIYESPCVLKPYDSNNPRDASERVVCED